MLNLCRMKLPRYFLDKIAGYYLYYTKHCVIECMHAHASDRKLTEGGSAKFFVLEDGSTIIQNRGVLNDREILKIQKFIKLHYLKCMRSGQRTVKKDFMVKTNKCHRHKGVLLYAA